MSVKRVAVFGGTFDPVHNGHLHIAEVAKERFALDLVIFVPCRQSPHKATVTLASDEERCEMLALALTERPWAEISTIEIDQLPPSYSWRTAEAMKDVFPEARLFWLMGADQWEVIDTWTRADYLAGLVEFIVFQRGESGPPPPQFNAHILDGAHPAEASKIRASAPDRLQSEWLDPKVEQFIRSGCLYGCGT